VFPRAEVRTGDFSHIFNPNGYAAVIYNPFTTRLVNGSYIRDPFRGMSSAQMLDSVR